MKPAVFQIDYGDEIRPVRPVTCEKSGDVRYCPATHESRLSDVIPDASLRYLVSGVVDLVRERGCDIDGDLRLSDGRIVRYSCSNLGNGKVEVRVHANRREMLELLNNLNTAKAAGDDLLHVCSWCKSVRGPDGRWLSVEQGLQSLDLSSDAPIPRLSHGVCPSCFEGVYSHLMSPRVHTLPVSPGAEQLALITTSPAGKTTP